MWQLLRQTGCICKWPFCRRMADRWSRWVRQGLPRLPRASGNTAVTPRPWPEDHRASFILVPGNNCCDCQVPVALQCTNGPLKIARADSLTRKNKDLHELLQECWCCHVKKAILSRGNKTYWISLHRWRIFPVRVNRRTKCIVSCYCCKLVTSYAVIVIAQEVNSHTFHFFDF